MKYNTTMILDGKTLDVVVEANSIKEAKILTKNQYKNSRVIGVSQITEERSFLDDITSPEFIQKHPEFLDRYVEGQKNKSLYIGDINYLEDKDGRTYYQDLRSKNYYCDYDVKNPSKEVLGLMIDETKFTPEQLEEKLKK